MDALDNQEASPSLLVKCGQGRRVELPWVPIAEDFLVSMFAGVAEPFEMILVCAHTRHVHVTRVPIAALAGGLRTKMYPDPKLRIPQPPRCSRIVFVERDPCWLEWARRDLQVFKINLFKRI